MASSGSFAITGTEFDFQDSASCCSPNFGCTRSIGLPGYSDSTEFGRL